MYHPKKNVAYRQNKNPRSGTKAKFRAANFPNSKNVEQMCREVNEKINKLFCLRSAGSWSKELLSIPGIGQLLIMQHSQNVKKILNKIKPKNKDDIEKALKLAAETPQQRFLILSEATMQGPLKPEAFQEYLSLFKQILPDHWKQLYGNKTPAQITQVCSKDWKRMK